jgi:hypothetical protein
MQESLGTNPISDDVPASLAGVAAATLRGSKAGLNLSFAIDRSGHVGKIVFRSKWKTGRRFALARLLADRIFVPAADRLRVATRACTYRQQVQRSFAAEFLSPFEAVEAMLDGDYSAEAQSDAAAHFVTNSSTLTRSASAACRIFDSRAGGREAYNFLSRGRIARVKIISVRIDRWALSSSVLPGGGSRGKGLILNPSPSSASMSSPQTPQISAVFGFAQVFARSQARCISPWSRPSAWRTLWTLHKLDVRKYVYSARPYDNFLFHSAAQARPTNSGAADRLRPAFRL